MAAKSGQQQTTVQNGFPRAEMRSATQSRRKPTEVQTNCATAAFPPLTALLAGLFFACAGALPPPLPGEEFVCDVQCTQFVLAGIDPNDPRLVPAANLPVFERRWGEALTGTCFEDSADAADFCQAAADFWGNTLSDQGDNFRCGTNCVALEGSSFDCSVGCPGQPDVPVFQGACFDPPTATSICDSAATAAGPACSAILVDLSVPCELAGAPSVFPLPSIGPDFCRETFDLADQDCKAAAAAAEQASIDPIDCDASAISAPTNPICSIYAIYTCTPLFVIAGDTAPAHPDFYDPAADGCECTGDCGDELCALFDPADPGQPPGLGPEVALDPPPFGVGLVCSPGVPDNTIRDTDWLFELDPAQSSFTVGNKTSDASGLVGLDGGFCPGGTCPITLRGLAVEQLDQLNFGLLGIPKVKEGRLRNRATASGTVAMGAVSFEPLAIDLEATWLEKRSLIGSFNDTGSTAFNDTALLGTIDFSTGVLDFGGTVTTGAGSVDFALIASLVNTRPTADAGPDQVIACADTATLSALASTDPDGFGDIERFRWFSRDATSGKLAFASLNATVTVEVAVGSTEFVLEVTDTTGSKSFDTVLVERVEDEPPSITSVTIEPDCLWPPNHKYIPYALGVDLLIDVVDDCDPGPAISISIVNVTSSEPDDGLGDGDTANDVAFGSDGVCLRSERAGPGPGRVYTVNVAAEDGAGNITETNVQVIVPHDQGPGSCAADGPGMSPALPESAFVDDDDPACVFSSVALASPPSSTPPPASSGGGSGGGGCSVVRNASTASIGGLVLFLLVAILLLRSRREGTAVLIICACAAMLSACGSADQPESCVFVEPSPCPDGTRCTTLDTCAPFRGSAELTGFGTANSAVAYFKDTTFGLSIGEDLTCHGLVTKPVNSLAVRLRSETVAGVSYTLEDPEVFTVMYLGLEGGMAEYATAAAVRLDSIGETEGESVSGWLQVETSSRVIEGMFAAFRCD